MNILIVEDEPEILSWFKNFINKSGHNTDTATTVTEAIKLLADNTYDFIFLDYNLPDKSGLEIVRYTRDNNLKNKIVMLTGYSLMQESIARFAGVDYYLEKPIDLDDVRKILSGNQNDTAK